MAFSASFRNIGSDSANFRASFSGGDRSYDNWRYVELKIDGETYEIKSTSKGGASSSFSKTIRGLTPNTEYDWTATLGYVLNGEIEYLYGMVTDEGSFTTESAITVEPWSWSSSNGQASTAQTKNAYSVIKGELSPYGNFSYKVWNDLVDKVMEVRDAKGYTWDSNGGTTQSGAKVSSGESLSAKKFNSVKYNIGTMRPTFTNVSSGDEILGSYFTKLTDVLNEIIDRL